MSFQTGYIKLVAGPPRNTTGIYIMQDQEDFRPLSFRGKKLICLKYKWVFHLSF